MAVRLLFLADTHLGIDLPARPRVDRPRRGDDFFANFERALDTVAAGETDLVVHGGDLFYRSRIPAWLAERVFTRLARLADSGADVVWVPGNHERSGVPRALLLSHPRIHVFDRPRTVVLGRQGLRIALAGIPFSPTIRRDFPALLAATGHARLAADVRLLCLHQAVEGATVGPGNFTFRRGDDVLPGSAVPAGFAAVLCGHIHRAQVLRHDLAGRPLAAPVLYPGSIERTSFAERDEAKGFMMLEVDRAPVGRHPVDRDLVARDPGRGVLRWEQRPLPARPMVDLELDPRASVAAVEAHLRAQLAALDPRSLVRIRLASPPPPEIVSLLRAGALRAASAPEMLVSVAWSRVGGAAGDTRSGQVRPHSKSQRGDPTEAQGNALGPAQDPFGEP